MTSLTFTLALLSLLTLVALALAGTAYFHTRATARAVAKQPETFAETTDSAILSLRTDLDGLAAQIHALQEIPLQNPVAAPARGGLNLGKRSQALRLHRHGNPPAQIASMLEIPLQEVELLLKVHQIVISNLQN
jgi:hypothetical protein